jgi:hypothetical protein
MIGYVKRLGKVMEEYDMRGLSQAYTGGNVNEVFSEQLSSSCLWNYAGKSKNRFGTRLVEVKDTEVDPNQSIILNS